MSMMLKFRYIGQEPFFNIFSRIVTGVGVYALYIIPLCSMVTASVLFKFSDILLNIC